MEKEFAIDKSETYGIATNIHIINEYIKELFNYTMCKI